MRPPQERIEKDVFAAFDLNVIGDYTEDDSGEEEGDDASSARGSAAGSAAGSRGSHASARSRMTAGQGSRASKTATAPSAFVMARDPNDPGRTKSWRVGTIAQYVFNGTSGSRPSGKTARRCGAGQAKSRAAKKAADAKAKAAAIAGSVLVQAQGAATLTVNAVVADVTGQRGTSLVSLTGAVQAGSLLWTASQAVLASTGISAVDRFTETTVRTTDRLLGAVGHNVEDLTDNGFYRLGRLTETAYSGLECVVWFGTLMVIWKIAERIRFFEVFLMLLRGGRSPEGNVDRHAIGTPDARGAGYVEVDAPDSTGTPGGASVAAQAADVGAPVQSLAARFDELAVHAAQSRRARGPDGNPLAPGSRAALRGQAATRRYANVPRRDAEAIDTFFQPQASRSGCGPVFRGPADGGTSRD